MLLGLLVPGAGERSVALFVLTGDSNEEDVVGKVDLEVDGVVKEDIGEKVWFLRGEDGERIRLEGEAMEGNFIRCWEEEEDGCC